MKQKTKDKIWNFFEKTCLTLAGIFLIVFWTTFFYLAPRYVTEGNSQDYSND